MGQRPSFSHLTGYPEAVASAQDFAPYDDTDKSLPARSRCKKSHRASGRLFFNKRLRILQSGWQKKERKKTDNPREGWEDGTPPPHRDFKERCVMR